MTTIKDKLPKWLHKYVAKPKPKNKKVRLKDWEDFVIPMEGDTVHVSENIDEILYGKKE